ncbi:MAG: FliA/WhiG family RNA polymerase sigma factor [Limnochordia bacterium]|jgi:RNA polymerase sigma factor for flagellar operon FliA|nr:FliA/WhiG family RNA polymerase sigma factor [Limnochordia bacterium]MDD2629271.1 FliA/WhiG family RNA polymerase sigma factor [Limnochordia bacterium]MDD4517275.1 FliA/WhiG family RNA polymerase sigma factor [Limnochordia bacterium]
MFQRENIEAYKVQSPRERQREELISDHLSLVRRIAERLAIGLPNHMQVDDLVGYGYLGLIEAAQRYDPCQGVLFSTFASKRIRGAMLDGIRSEDWLPDSQRRKIKAMERAYAELDGRFGRPATDAEVADALHIDLTELYDLQQKASSTTMLSLELMISSPDGDGGQLSDLIADRQAVNPQQRVVEEDLRNRLAQAIGSLPERDQMILSLYYYEELTISAIGEVLGISKGRVSQLHTRAIMRLKSMLEDEAHELLKLGEEVC